ncbi:uncharacterized protein LOC118650628 [Myotis myotis]|uniref:uncharacterized protein LOC118650628 n=1 Tax=Myotis myotis TaxID=51298 RepID=UPI001749552F|nr:uncharacterized protein LOC118650628 [Myotis myotis]
MAFKKKKAAPTSRRLRTKRAARPLSRGKERRPRRGAGRQWPCPRRMRNETAVSAAIFFAGKDREQLGASFCAVKRVGGHGPRPQHLGDVERGSPLWGLTSSDTSRLAQAGRGTPPGPRMCTVLLRGSRGRPGCARVSHRGASAGSALGVHPRGEPARRRVWGAWCRRREGPGRRPASTVGSGREGRGRRCPETWRELGETARSSRRAERGNAAARGLGGRRIPSASAALRQPRGCFSGFGEALPSGPGRELPPHLPCVPGGRLRGGARPAGDPGAGRRRAGRREGQGVRRTAAEEDEERRAAAWTPGPWLSVCVPALGVLGAGGRLLEVGAVLPQNRHGERESRPLRYEVYALKYLKSGFLICSLGKCKSFQNANLKQWNVSV